MSRYDIHTMTVVPALDVHTASVTLDESWAPYVQASLSCSIPATLTGLDPFARDRLRFTLTQSFSRSQPVAAMSAAWAGLTLADLAGDYPMLAAISAQFGAPLNSVVMPAVARHFDLGIRSRTRDPLTGVMTLTLASDEALAQDKKWNGTTEREPFTRSLIEAVQFGLALIGARAEIQAPDFLVELEATAWKPGVSVWDWLAPMVQAAGLRLYCNELGRWFLTGPLAPHPEIALSPTTGLISAPETLSRDTDWYDAMIVEYTGGTVPVYDFAGTPGSSRTGFISLASRYPGPGAAAASLARSRSLGVSMTPVAVSNYLTEPGSPLAIVHPGYPTRSGYVRAVTFTYPDSTMTTTPRDLAAI